MKRALIVISDGVEDIEAIAPLDILNRAGVEVIVASLKPGPVSAAYGSTLVPTTTVDNLSPAMFNAVILPGGKRNAEALSRTPRVVDLVRDHLAAGRVIAAICAAPGCVLAEGADVLKDRRATGDPGFNDKLLAGGAILTHEHVTIDGQIVTAMGPGAALAFGLTITEMLVGRLVADGLASYWQIARSQHLRTRSS